MLRLDGYISLKKRLIWLLLGLLVTLLIGLKSEAESADPWIPTTPVTWDEHYARLPDWSQLTFETLPPITTDGTVSLPGSSSPRSWTAGQPVDTFLTLGDFQTSLYPQLFNLRTLAQITGMDLEQVALGALEMAGWQTIDDLISSIPGLGQYRVEQVPPLEALIAKSLPISGEQRLQDLLNLSASDLTLAAVLEAFSDLGQQPLGQLGAQLHQFALTDIPGLAEIPLQNLRDWGNSTLHGVPGLAAVPLDQMPNPISAVGAIGQIDVVYGPAETRRQKTISGSYQQGFQVPCQENCAHVELTGTPDLHGKQWISGQMQQIEGGEGVLAAVNGGKEPTGRHPFGDAFKVVLWDLDESSGSVRTALFFRFCQRGGFLSPDLGCTPYFIGPVPFMSYQETEFMLVGALENAESAGVPLSALSPARGQAPAQSSVTQKSAGKAPNLTSGSGSCRLGADELDLSTLAKVVSESTGHPSEIGPYGCDGKGQCGRSLGSHSLMGYRPEVRAFIKHQPGGPEFLTSVDSGAAVNQDELARFFPKAAQLQVLKADLAVSLQQAQQEGLTGTDLMERVGQIYFGGSAVPVGGTVADLQGRPIDGLSDASLSQAYTNAIGCMGFTRS